MLRVDLLGPDTALPELIVTGRLTMADVVILRRAVHKCAAGNPSGIIVNLDSVAVDQPLACLVVPMLHRYCATLRPPVLLVVLCRAESAAGQALLRSTFMNVPVFDDSATARAYALSRARPWPTSRLRFARFERTTARAVRFSRRTCERWRLSWTVHRIELVTAELSANAIQHSPVPLDLTLHLRPDNVRVAVRDTSRALPHLTLDTIPQVARGLGLVELLSVRWGTFLYADGKTVWADVPLDDGGISAAAENHN
jgi:hypothetical protein